MNQSTWWSKWKLTQDDHQHRIGQQFKMTEIENWFEMINKERYFYIFIWNITRINFKQYVNEEIINIIKNTNISNKKYLGKLNKQK